MRKEAAGSETILLRRAVALTQDKPADIDMRQARSKLT